MEEENSSVQRLVKNMKQRVNSSQSDCMGEVNDIFEKLASWKEESLTQWSKVIHLHHESVNKGIDDLVEEVDRLKAQLSASTKERNNLIETVKILSDEISTLNSKLLFAQSSFEPEQNDVHNTSETDLEEVKEELVETPTIRNEKEDFAEVVQDQTALEQHGFYLNVEQNSNELSVNLTNDEHVSVNEDYPKETVQDCTESDNHVDSESNLEISPEKMLKIPVKNVHTMLDSNEVTAEEQDETRCEGDNTQKKKVCEDCGYASRRTYHLRRHRESRHKTTEKGFKCEQCPYKALYKDNLRRHSDAVHNKGEKRHRCENCPYTSAESQKLKYHKIAVHKLGEKFKCDICPYSSASKYRMQEHKRVVHEKMKNHRCEECSYAAPNKSTLKRHIESVHKMGEKGFKCGLCPYAAFKGDHVKRHRDAVHNQGEKRNKCDHCPYTSAERQQLKYHKISFHKIGEKYKCDECPYSSAGKYRLQDHKRLVHEKTREHSCDECDFTASKKSTLNRHMETEHKTGEK